MFRSIMQVLRPSPQVDPRDASLYFRGIELEEKMKQVRKENAEKLLIPDVDILNRVRKVA